MTTHRTLGTLGSSPALDQALDRFAPLLEELRAESARNDVERNHPFDVVARLASAGLGAVRLPVADGGAGLTLVEFYDLLVAVGAADSNLPQALRQHYFRVELTLLGEPGERRDGWLRSIAGGTIFGNATSEAGDVQIGQVNTRLTRHEGGGFRLNGKKFYSTGNLYAQFIPVAAADEDGEQVVVIVPRDRAGIEVSDDWPGFGQKLTASGTTTFSDVIVDDSEIVYRGAPSSHHGMGFHQLVLLATIAGIARAAADDLRDQVASRTRVYSAGSGDLPRFDPLVQEAVGRAEAAAVTARALVLAAASDLQAAWDSWADPEADPVITSRLFAEADVTVSAAQVAIIPLVLEQTSHVFDSLGASATHHSIALDRHWRNARTVSSHNPWIYKARQVGDFVLNGTLAPIFVAGSDVGVHASASVSHEKTGSPAPGAPEPSRKEQNVA
jgi:alkylation response protein AidB-like acyl-CoA dehydrogenase